MKGMRCTLCGCTDDRACPGGCAWWKVSPPICTGCVARHTKSKASTKQFAAAVALVLHASRWKKPT